MYRMSKNYCTVIDFKGGAYLCNFVREVSVICTGMNTLIFFGTLFTFVFFGTLFAFSDFGTTVI